MTQRGTEHHSTAYTQKDFERDERIARKPRPFTLAFATESATGEMTVETPKVLAYTTAGWASACGFKARHPNSVIVRGAGMLPTLFIVNRAYFKLWLEGRAALPGEEKA